MPLLIFDVPSTFFRRPSVIDLLSSIFCFCQDLHFLEEAIAVYPSFVTLLYYSAMSVFLKSVRVPSLASLYGEDCRLPNVGMDYTRIGGPRRYTWNPEGE